ncbi:hypothetical protein ACP4OV_030447 [Aristida adscensionis]
MPGGGARIRRPPSPAGLPDEILHEILLRMPAKSVLRCGAVCRPWRRLTSDPAFLAAHHRHQPTLPLISSSGTADPRYVDPRFVDPRFVDAVDLRRGERRPVLEGSSHGQVYALCDGLIIFGRYVCNPATRQRWSLGLAFIDLVGLFHHQPSGEYRVLFWTQSNTPSEEYCLNDYCVLTLGSGDPRRLACSLDAVDEEVISGMGPYIRDAPVLLHGNLHVHWQKRTLVAYHRILVFDTVAESFRQMRPPAVNPAHVMQLFDMGGMLAASCTRTP